MALQNAFGDITLESTQQELLGGVLVLLSAILDKLPRIDGNDRLMVNPTEVTSGITIVGGTVPTVTTVSTVSNQTNIGGRDASHAAYALANSGAMHIYDNLKFS